MRSYGDRIAVVWAAGDARWALSAPLPLLLDRIQRVQRDLVLLAFDEPDREGLPAWTAPLALGETPLHPLPEELLEDLLELARFVDLPRVASPSLQLRSRGNLTASSIERFELLLGSNGAADHVVLRPSTWIGGGGERFLLPPQLAGVLEAIAEGPPRSAAAEGLASLTRARMLWWAGIRPTLLRFGVALDRYLDSADAVVVDKLRARLASDSSGRPILEVTADGCETEGLNRAAEAYNPRREQDPTIRWRGPEGATRQQRVLLTDRGRRALAVAGRVRKRSVQAQAQLIDAPETILDPEFFDLSEYSPRVTGVTTAVYRVSRSMVGGSGAKGAGTLDLEPVGDQASGEKSTLSLSGEDKERLSKLLQEASEKGSSYVMFDGAWIRVPSADRLDELTQTEADGLPPARGALVPALNVEEASYAVDDLGTGAMIGLPLRPLGLAAEYALFPHQHRGWAWLAGHALVCESSTDHGLLADDMGLGKTIQVLSLMSLLKRQGQLGPTLVVAPVSLLENWQVESDRFFPGRFVNRIQLGGGVRPSCDELKTKDVVFASYETVRTQQLELGRVRWRLLVIDESHRIKNPTAQTTHALLSMDAERRIALTGTPLQNSLDDLWSQFDWLSPGLLGDLRSFRQRYSGDDEEELNQLRDLVAPRILRRLKEDEVRDSLPPKELIKEHRTLGEDQLQLYEAILSAGKAEGKRGSFGTLHKLFQVCACPEALGHGWDEGRPHPKLDWLFSVLDQVAEKGEKAIVFAEWYSLQDKLCAEIGSRYGVFVDRLNGKVEQGLRLAKVQRFNESQGFGAMVLGPKAAGVGLNITGANHVVHFTRHWNPALEAQATDRAYRIGQVKPVFVYQCIMHHPHRVSIEAHLDQLLESKMAMARDVIVPTSSLDLGSSLRSVVFSDQ